MHVCVYLIHEYIAVSCLFCSHHIRLFFPDPNPSLGVHELERHPVISRLKEAFREGEQSGDARCYSDHYTCLHDECNLHMPHQVFRSI